jgi:hypothetical protein
MQFFLDQIAARILGLYVFISCGRTLWRGLVERKIDTYNDDWIGGMLIDWSKWINYRDTTPIRYWISISLYAFAVVGGLGVAIFGWFRPDP